MNWVLFLSMLLMLGCGNDGHRGRVVVPYVPPVTYEPQVPVYVPPVPPIPSYDLPVGYYNRVYCHGGVDWYFWYVWCY